MEQTINNKHNIKIFIETDHWLYDKIYIYDSEHKYFNDIWYDNPRDVIDTIEFLEEATMEDICWLFGHKIYDNLESLNQANIFAYDDTSINTFIINNKIVYTLYK